MNSNKHKENYLDFIPVHNPKYEFGVDEENNITIYVENKGLFNRIAQVLFKKPKVSQVHLDEMGNFIWPLIDGNRSVYEIALIVDEHFGQKAQPLYERLVKYMGLLQSNDFIIMKR